MGKKIKELEMHETYIRDYLGYAVGSSIKELPSTREIFDKINEIIRHINGEVRNGIQE